MALPVALLLGGVIAFAHPVRDFPVENEQQIAPGVTMPLLNLGGMSSRPSNWSLFFSLGGRGVDSALSYGEDQQRNLGREIAQTPVPRSEIFVTTKIPCCPYPNPLCDSDWSNATVNTENVMRELGLGYVDLILVHWECPNINDTLAAYQSLLPMLDKGTARAVGVSNFRGETIDFIVEQTGVKPAVNQLGLFVGITPDADASIDYAIDNGITVMAYSVLGAAGSPALNWPDVQRIAAAKNVTPAQVALRFVAQSGARVTTAGTDVEYLREDLDIMSFKLSRSDMACLSKLVPDSPTSAPVCVPAPAPSNKGDHGGEAAWTEAHMAGLVCGGIAALVGLVIFIVVLKRKFCPSRDEDEDYMPDLPDTAYGPLDPDA